MPKFFVNQGTGRVPEGPFEEQQIVHFIRSGKLTKGYVCAVGAQRFVALDREPAFARALAQVGHAIEAPARAPKAAPQSSNRGLLLLAIMSIFVLALSAVAIGTHVMFGTGGMPIRSALPADTQAFFEVESVPAFVADLANVRALDTSRVVVKRLLDELATELSASFGVPMASANSLVLSAKSLGIAARGQPNAREGGVLISFSGAAPVNAFLSSKRFTYSGLVAKSGRKYKLAAANRGDATERGLLCELTLRSETNVLVWFETSKVLFVGSLKFAESVARVVSLDAPSIEQTRSFRDARRAYTERPNAVGFLFDPSQVFESSDPNVEAIFSKYLRGAAPVAARLDLVRAGVLLRLVGQLEASTLTPPLARGPLTVIDRLPLETFGYAAWSANSALPAAELVRWFSMGVEGAGPRWAATLGRALAQAQSPIVTKAYELLGPDVEEVAVALLAPAGYRMTLTQPTALLKDFALVCTTKLSDEAHARALAKRIATELSVQAPELQLQTGVDGFQATSQSLAGLSAQVRVTNRDLMFALGNDTLVAHALSAFSTGRETLADDPAQRAARTALPKQAQFVSWLDLGRIVDTAQKNPILSAGLHNLGLGAIHFTGAERATAAVSLLAEERGGSTTYRLDALNLPLFAWLLAPSGE